MNVFPRPLPPGYRMRSPRDGDIPLILSLGRTIDTSRHGDSDMTEGEVVEDLSLPRLDLEDDVWLVEAADGELVGYGLFWMERPPCEAVCWQLVHPAHRGRGLTETLLELGESRAHAAVARAGLTLSLGTFTDGDDRPQADLFARHGFAQTREFRRMEVTFDAPPPAPVWPAGIEVRGFCRDRDEAAVHAAMDEAFQDHFRPWDADLEEWRRVRFDRPDLDLGLWWVAWDGEAAAGSVLAFALPTGGYIDELGVRRPWRGRGLGRALLLQALGSLFARGMGRMFLSVDSVNPSGAVRLYESVGMTPTLRHVFWEKEIEP